MAFQIVTPATVEPVTLQEAKLQCKIITDVLDVEAYAEDSLIESWITTARAVAEHYTGRSLAPQTLEMALNCFPEAGFDLDMPPVASITSIKYADPAFPYTITHSGSGVPDPGLGIDGDVYWRTDTDVIYVKSSDTWAVSAQQLFATVETGKYKLSTYGTARRVELAYGATWPTTRDEPEAVRVRYVAGYAVTPPAVKAALQLMVGWFNEHRGSEMDPDDIQPPAAKALLNTVKVWGW